MSYMPEVIEEQLEGFLREMHPACSWDEFEKLPLANLEALVKSKMIDATTSHKNIAPSTKQMVQFGKLMKRAFGIDIVFHGALGEGWFAVNAVSSSEPVRDPKARLRFMEFACDASAEHRRGRLEAFWD